MVLDEKGNKIGVPIKASSVYSKPTLSFLEKKFKENELLKQQYRRSMKTSIDWIMIKPPGSLLAFKNALAKEKIQLVIRENDMGIIYGLTYVDHKTKCVFNGSEIGKEYSAKSILVKCGIYQSIDERKETIQSNISKEEKPELSAGKNLPQEQKQEIPGVLEELMKPIEQFNYTPFEFRKRKNKIMSQTGENEQGLRKIVDLTRIVSLTILLIHFYYYCYGAFKELEITSKITDRLLSNIFNTGLFSNFHKSKLIALICLIISLLGSRGKKNEKLNYKVAFANILSGSIFYFGSIAILYIHQSKQTIASFYISVTVLGFILILRGALLLSRIISLRLNNSVFNSLNETFPQEERLLSNEYSINLPARYNLKGKLRKSWINIINPFRGVLIMGSPGSGKSYFVIQHIIKQHI